MAYSGRILIVDADLAVQRLLAALATRNFLEPVIAANGTTALLRLETERFDVIVLDLDLPELNGTDVLRFLYDTQPHLLERTLVVTAAPESLYRDCPYSACTWTVVRKPLEVEPLEQQLLECYAEHLRTAQRQAHPAAPTDVAMPVSLRTN